MERQPNIESHGLNGRLLPVDVALLVMIACTVLVVMLGLEVFGPDADTLLDNPLYWLGCILGTSAGLFGAISILVHVAHATSKNILKKWVLWATIICFSNWIILGLFYVFYLRSRLKGHTITAETG